MDSVEEINCEPTNNLTVNDHMYLGEEFVYSQTMGVVIQICPQDMTLNITIIGLKI